MSTSNSTGHLARLAVVAMAAAFLAGCGSTTTTSSPSTTTATTGATAELEKYRAELKPQNEAIEAARHNFEQVHFTGSNYSEVEAALTTYANAVAAYLKSLEQIQPPVAVASAAQNYTSQLQKHLGDVEQAAKSARAHDGAAVTADLEKANTSAKECTVASEFYAEACRW